MPVVIRGWGNEVAVHRPVVVFAEGEAVGRVVVRGDAEGNEVGGVDETDVVGGGKFDPETAGGALVVVDFKYFSAEGRAAAEFGFLFGDALGLRIWDRGLGI